MQVIQDFECCFVALLRLLNGFCFGDALLRVGQVAFSGRYCFRCGFKLFPLYEFDGGVAEALSTVYLVARIPKTVACRISQPAKVPRKPDTKITFVIHPVPPQPSRRDGACPVGPAPISLAAWYPAIRLPSGRCRAPSPCHKQTHAIP